MGYMATLQGRYVRTKKALFLTCFRKDFHCFHKDFLCFCVLTPWCPFSLRTSSPRCKLTENKNKNNSSSRITLPISNSHQSPSCYTSIIETRIFCRTSNIYKQQLFIEQAHKNQFRFVCFTIRKKGLFIPNSHVFFSTVECKSIILLTMIAHSTMSMN